MSRNFKRHRLAFVLALVSFVVLALVGRWLNATKVGGQQPAEPFRIAGNFYYVGANDVAAFLMSSWRVACRLSRASAWHYPWI
jgi:hypothetical protein